MTERSNAVRDKSYQFALSVIAAASGFQKNGEYILSRQLVRSGTSIGANVEEAQAASSKADFKNKMNIAEKEAKEAHYWLRLLKDSKLLSLDQAESLLRACEELKRLLAAITKTVGQSKISH